MEQSEIGFKKVATKDIAFLAKDVVVRMGDFYYVNEFYILNEKESRVAIILSPFLHIARAIINCATGALQLTFDNERGMVNTWEYRSKLKTVDVKDAMKTELLIS